jgi:DNA polymerase-3 subunit beta
LSTAKAAASFTASRSALIAMLTAASRVAGNGKPIPVLGSVWLCATADRLSWWVTDTSLWRGGSIEVEVSQPGSGLVPVSLTLAALKQCAEGPVSLTLAANVATLKSAGFTAKLPLLPAEDFPTLPIVPDGGVVIPGASLARMIDQVDPAILQESSQYSLRGAHLVVGPAGVQMTATDRHRMARSMSSAAVDAPESAVILPREAMTEIAAMLADDPDQAVVYFAQSERHIFRVGSEIVNARAIDGEFPACDRIIPKKWGTRMVCDRDGWLKALNRVVVVTDAKNPCVTVEIADGDMVLTTQSVDRGDAVERLAVETQGVPLKFCAKPGYLKDFLASALSKQVSCEIFDDKSAIALKPIEDESSYVYVVMPMRL